MNNYEIPNGFLLIYLGLEPQETSKVVKSVQKIMCRLAGRHCAVLSLPCMGALQMLEFFIVALNISAIP